MARETKVGLLAGLAFIICFAIILANRGRHDFITRQVQQLVDRSTAAHGTGPSAPVSRESSDRHATSQADRAAAVRQPTDALGGENESDAVFAEGLTADGVASVAVNTGGIADDTGPAAARPNGTPLTAPSAPDPADQIRRLERRIQDLNAELRTRQAAAPTETVDLPPQSKESAPPPVVKPKAATVYHTVAAGETLSRIAQAHYGARSPTHINAIFDANRSVLANPDTIVVGMKLAMPAVPGVTPVHESSPTATGPRPPGKDEAANPAAPSPRPFRWYQIKKDDRYVTIAREVLGSESRWQEIYEMNKSTFPDAGQIREGVRIKIPVLDVADARGRRR